MIKVLSMTSPSSGKNVANQFIIRTNEGEYFQSYTSIIAFKPYPKDLAEVDDRIVLDEYFWNYSRTTSKYRNEFLGESTNDTKKKIKNGIYRLENLNE